MASTRRDDLLDAAYERFSRYGFRRTSMEDIAQAAGISRAAVYLHFGNKEDVFRALARGIQERGLAAAVSAAGDGTVEQRLRGVLLAKVAETFALVHGSEHGRELLDENSRLCGDITAEFRARHVDLIRDLVAGAARRGELRPRGVGLDAPRAAELVMDCARGLEVTGAPDAATFRQRVGELARLLAAGLGATRPKGAPARATGPRRSRATRT